MSQVTSPDMIALLVCILTGFFGLGGIMLSNRRKNGSEHKSTDEKLDHVIAELADVRLTGLETREDARSARSEFQVMKATTDRSLGDINGRLDNINGRLDGLEHT